MIAAMTLGEFCFAAGLGILIFCVLCGVVFTGIYLIDEHQRKERSK